MKTSENGFDPAELELWGGIECTINRVRDIFMDQCRSSGHDQRPHDLTRIAELGVRKLRYPVLWEKVAPLSLDDPDWSAPDDRLLRITQLGMDPIVGLVHHGSGPEYTDLTDPAFPEKLAIYAGLVAERYPWVEHYTPVNEPLTTARFSGFYGHWYPHATDARAWARILLNECRGTVLAMRSIRAINPGAKLVQTEDMGKVYAVPRLAYQAEHENERRWLSFDLLCGRVREGHSMWEFLTENCGVDPRELEWFAQNPCPPDILGINYYVTSERFLDDRLERYPHRCRGGNGRDAYADVEAVRVVEQGIAGHQAILTETWERYRLPVAVTEVHLGCTREEQLRWLLEAWHAAKACRAGGMDCRAITVWSILGAYDWNSLLTRADGYYESGVFDLSRGYSRPTAIAKLMPALAQGVEPDLPAVRGEGWWRRPIRFEYPAVAVPTIKVNNPVPSRDAGRPLLITGATGTLGQAFGRICELRGIAYELLSRRQLEISDATSAERVLDEVQPWAVINCAGYVRVDDAEDDSERCFRENAEGAAVLAKACEERSLPLVTFSSDLVFDGSKSWPYLEHDAPQPLSVYGASKLEAEQRAVASCSRALVIRTSAFFGPWDEHNFVTQTVQALMEGKPVRAACDSIVSPTYVPDLVNETLNLLIDGEVGIWHLANMGEVTWAELAVIAANAYGLDSHLIEPCSPKDIGWQAPRPSYSALDSTRSQGMRALDAAIAQYRTQNEVLRNARLAV